MCQPVIIGFAEEQSAGKVGFCRPHGLTALTATREKCTVARSYFVSHVLLSWQNGQSTAEDGVTPAVKVATHSPMHTHIHTHSYIHSKRDSTFIRASSRNKNYTERLFFNL